MFLAVEEHTNLLVSIKEISLDRIEKINQELAIYREIDEHSIQAAILKTYQMYTHDNIYVIVKEGYECSF